MAVTIKQKQAFLESMGKQKSLTYFMTGPNLGPDWSWSKALSGGYSAQQLDEFLNKGAAAYAAHKGKSASTPAPAPADGPDPAGVGAACAKSAAKAIVSAASQVKLAVSETLSHVWPLQGVDLITEVGQYPNFDFGKALQLKLSQLRKELVDELGPLAPEVTQVHGALETLKALETMKYMQDAAYDYAVAGLEKFDSAGEILEEMYLARNLLKTKAKTVDEAATVLDELLESQVVTGGQEMSKLVFGWYDEVVSMMDDIALDVFTNSVTDAAGGAFQYLSTFVQLADSGLYDVQSTGLVVQKLLKEMGDYAEGLGYTEYLANGALAGTAPERLVKEVFDALATKIHDQIADLSSPKLWLGGDVLQPNSLITKYATFDDFVADLNKTEKILGQAQAAGLVKFDVVPAAVIDAAEEGFDLAKAAAAQQVPGPKTVAQGFDLDALKAASTDELNPMVQAALEAQGETPSLVYFMTKGQKVDLLSDGWETFAATHYDVKYKGQTLSGGGLETAKLKYAAKQGSPPPKATVHAEKSTGSMAEALEKKVATVDAGGVDTITGQPTPLPHGSPSWWADPFTESQAHYVEQLVSTNALEEVFDAGGWYEAAKAGTLTKGQMSNAISMLQEYDAGIKTVFEADDVKAALNYGQYTKVSALEEALESLESPGPSVDDVLAPSVPGPSVSTAKPATSVAPDNAHWDAPHTWTYRGDGQSKWGGAHRKWWFQDEEGNDWMLKHGADFRSEGELAAHRVAHQAGFDVAEARVVTLRVEGRAQTGVIQKMYRSDDIVGTLDDALGHGALSDLPEETLKQLQEHQVLDWLLGNHDSHMQNFLVLKDGRLVGVDKGQAFKFYGKDRLAHDYKPDGNFGEIAYNRMWSQYRAGDLDLDLDAIDDALRRVEAMSDDELRNLVDTYAVGRFGAPSNQAFLSGTSAKNAQELVEQVLERKRTIRSQFEAFYGEQAKARGVTWEPGWGKPVRAKIHEAKPKVVKSTDVLTPIDEDLAAAVNRVGTAGKAVYVAGTEVERGQVLFDVVAQPSGKKMVRMNLNLRPEGEKKLLAIVQAEGGAALKATGNVAADIPANVVALPTVKSTSISLAKTVNHHVGSGDFQFNSSTLSSAVSELSTIERNPTVQRWVGEGLETVEDVEKAHPGAFTIARKDILEELAADPDGIEDWIALQATKATQTRTYMTYRSHLKAGIEEVGKGAKATKVALVPDFDPIAYFEKVRAEARAVVTEALEGAPKVKAVPAKVFDSIGQQRVQTTAVRKGEGLTGRNDPVGVLQGWHEIAGTSKQQYVMTTRINGKQVQIAYRDTVNSEPSLKGWMEVLMDTDSDVVTAEDLAALHSWLNDTIGVSAKLADSVDMELTYWRMVQGNYRLSSTYQSGGNKWQAAVDTADRNLRRLGPDPSPQEEIAAIRGAYRDVFGAQIDDADVLPIHSHAVSREADEIGWGYWERPELTDDEIGSAMDGYALRHSVSGELSQDHVSASTGQGMMSQNERLRHGITASAMSASADIGTGGAAGFFTRLARTSSPIRSDMVVVAPHRRVRRLLDYNANHDTYGRLAERTSISTLDPKVAAGYARQSGNEFMLRDLVSHFDDIEISVFSNRVARDEALSMFRSRGITHIRGVPIEERLVLARDLESSYVERFFKKYVNPRERLRRSAEALAGAGARVSQTAQAVGSRLASRFPTVKGGVVRKQVSVGRSARVYVTRPGHPQEAFVTRYHVGENAISVPEGLLEDALSASDAPFVWGKAKLSKSSGSGIEHSPPGDYLLIDLAPFGFDIKTMPATKRKRFIQGFVSAVTQGDGVLAEFITKWGGVL